MNNDEFKCGYISPDGIWYGCKPLHHYELEEKLGISFPEEFGWIKVFEGSNGLTYYSRRKFLTESQIKILTDRGIKIKKSDIKE